jgi:tetratricopeptide (TPR) repeat protein
VKLHVRGPPGTRIEETEKRIERIEDTIRGVIPPHEIETMLDILGTPYSGLNLSLSEGALISPADGQILIAHRLVMRVVRDELARQGRLTAVCRAAASVLDARARALRGSRDRLAIRDIPEQVAALQNNMAGPADTADEELAESLLSLRFWALYYLNELGDSVSQAIAVGEQLTADFERVLGHDHPDTLNARNGLAIAYEAAGRIDEAIALHEQTLAAFERVLGHDHPDTLASRNNLAIAYEAAGRIDEAIALHEQALAAYEHVRVPDHPDILASRNNLANAYRAAGRAAEAIALHEQTLAAYERVLGPDHPSTLSSRNNLANAYRAAGRFPGGPSHRGW